MKLSTPTFDEWARMSEEDREALRLEFAAASIEADIAEVERGRLVNAVTLEVAAAAGLTPLQAAAALEAYASAAIGSLKSGKDVTFPGLGKFSAARKTSRRRRSAGTVEAPGAETATNLTLTFEPAKALRDALNS